MRIYKGIGCRLAVLAAAAAWAAVSCEGPIGSEPAYKGPWKAYEVRGLPEGTRINEIYMFSPTDGWAVAYPGYILRFDGTEWRVHTDLSREFGRLDIRRLSFCAPDEGWALGHTRDNETGYELHVFRFDGTVWTRRAAIPAELKKCYYEYDVAVLAPDDVWVANYFGVFHYDGRTWKETQTGTLYYLSFSSATNGWAAGSFHARRWNGSEWEYTSGRLETASDIGCPSDDTAWAVGGYPGDCGIRPRYGISRWDETKKEWETYYDGRFKDEHFVFERVHFASRADGWAVGDHVAAKYNGTEWREVGAPPSPNCIFSLGGDEVWISCGDGKMYKYNPGTPE